MILLDVNVLVHAHREDADRHPEFRAFLESAREWITTDRDFARFPGLRWRHPLKP